MKPKILLVEDNEQNRYLAQYILEDAGMEVVCAVTGVEGLAMARSSRPDLILLDIQLPEMDGYQVLAKLKTDPELAAIPVVAVTSFAMPGERQRALEGGCLGYIEKPIPPDFDAQVRALLNAGGKLS
jgi:two-component system, cell cycle response regulator DivK